MKKFFLAALAAGVALSLSAHAAEYKKGDLVIADPWARASAMMAGNGVVFMTIANRGAGPDRLTKAAANVSEVVELHTHQMENGVMRMRQVPGIDVEPGGQAVLKPGGLHVMLINLKTPLVAGQTFPVTLTFEKAGDVTVDAIVAAPGAMEMPVAHHHRQ